jgi:hypothetical protein
VGAVCSCHVFLATNTVGNTPGPFLWGHSRTAMCGRGLRTPKEDCQCGEGTANPESRVVPLPYSSSKASSEKTVDKNY